MRISVEADLPQLNLASTSISALWDPKERIQLTLPGLLAYRIVR